MNKLFALYDAVIDWMARGFQTVVPETFIALGIIVLVVAWLVLHRWIQRCPHCHRFVRRAQSVTLRCRRCGRQYYYGLRAMR